ncbi:MAG: hippurate hydrolase [Elusimicrobia bacterium]|nr:MAG: hippurate hydrolase [Elusimicrobiota bacterium]KAF0155051.1 MAG: hippurate hydrolase [Elusimicrobiota bacterium]
MNIPEEIKKLVPEMTAWRHELHAHPETAFEEKWTSAFIAGKLKEFSLEPHTGLAGTGVVATLKAGSSRRSIALRADMDALPLTEGNGFAHRSVNEGRMHGCGHDGHVAMLLGAAKYLSAKKDFDGTVHFVFQPAEEGGGGADKMVKEGLFDKFPCDAVYGMHNWPALPLGQFGVRPGPMMASSDKFEITLSGHGCHAAMPHTGVDLVVTAAAIVQSLHTIVSRSIDPVEPAVVSVSILRAGGEAYNIIPDSVFMRGTARAFSPATQEIIERRIREICDGVCAANGARAKVEYFRNYPPTINDEAQTSVCAGVAAELAGKDNVVTVKQVMGAEDFSFMLREKPGCYVFAGTGPLKDGRALHNPKFDFNDNLLPIGAAYWSALAAQVLKG